MKRNLRLKNRLASVRRRKRLQQKHVAAMLGQRSIHSVSQYESGNVTPGLKTMIMLSIIYRTPIRALMHELTEACRQEVFSRRSSARLAVLGDRVTDAGTEFCTAEERLNSDDANETDYQKSGSHLAKLLWLRGEKMGHLTPLKDLRDRSENADSAI